MLNVPTNTYVVDIDSDLCCQCGSCVKVCPCGKLEMGEKSVVKKEAARCLGCTQCTAVCPTRAIHAVKRPGAPAEQAEPVPTEDYGDKNPFMPLPDISLHVAARRSVRDFKPDVPSREVLDSVIQACRYAPTACNFRKIRYAVVSDPEHMKTLRELCLKAMPMAGRNMMPGPVVVLVINDLPKEFGDDATIAATTFDLVARSVGLGCTFAGILRRLIASSEEVRKYLDEVCGIKDLADHYVQALYLGYPSDEIKFLRPAVRDPVNVTWA